MQELIDFHNAAIKLLKDAGLDYDLKCEMQSHSWKDKTYTAVYYGILVFCDHPKYKEAVAESSELALAWLSKEIENNFNN